MHFVRMKRVRYLLMIGFDLAGVAQSREFSSTHAGAIWTSSEDERRPHSGKTLMLHQRQSRCRTTHRPCRAGRAMRRRHRHFCCRRQMP